MPREKTRGLDCYSSPQTGRPSSIIRGSPSSDEAHAGEGGRFDPQPVPTSSQNFDVSTSSGGAGRPNARDKEAFPAVLEYESPLSQRSGATDAITPASTGLITSDSLRLIPSEQSLEDVPGTTAHSMGLTAEQDTQLLDTFRSVIMSERNEIDANVVQVFSGDPRSHAPPVHFLLLQDGFPEHTNLALRSASDAIESIVEPYGPLLVRLYFRHIHPAYPIVSKARFLRQYASAKTIMPASLRGAVYALASSFWHLDSSQNVPCPFTQHVLVGHAHDALRRELEAPNLSKLQACLLLLHMRPPDIDSVETPSIWILAAQATACAQLIGLHRDSTQWQIPAWEKMLRKKLWWATFVADCWSAVCHGNPPHISTNSFNTPCLELKDMRFDEDVPPELQYLVDLDDSSFHVAVGARLVATAQLAMHLRPVLDCASLVETGRQKPGAGSFYQDELSAVRETIREWSSLLPQCLSHGRDTNSLTKHMNAPLHVSYFAAQALLFRGLMHPATKRAKASPASSLRRWFPDALAEFEKFVNFMTTVTDNDLASFWVRRESHIQKTPLPVS
ncbi:transcriptional regulatory protein [Paramyrothecium foliicola]|nr:transcriptional regulatory protein [Paramyrothecium foliicola]